MAVPFVSKLLSRGPENPAAPNNVHPPGSEIGVQPMYGTPYGVVLRPFLSPIGLPCARPPWGYGGDRPEDDEDHLDTPERNDP
jgi:quinoprotein glucose dehydrogenase